MYTETDLIRTTHTDSNLPLQTTYFLQHILYFIKTHLSLFPMVHLEKIQYSFKESLKFVTIGSLDNESALVTTYWTDDDPVRGCIHAKRP